MKQIVVALLLPALMLVGCSRAQPAPAPGAPAPGAPVGLSPDRVPAAPLWGPPGTTILGRDGAPLFEVLAPLPFGSRTLQPIRVEQVIYLMHEAEGKLWLDGTIYPMLDLLHIAETPSVLTELPYAQGTVWNLWGPGYGPRVAGFEQVATPAGTFPAVVVQNPEVPLREWWAPGLGLVKRQEGAGIQLAQRVEHREPAMLSKVKQITPDLLAIVANGGMYDQNGRRLVDFGHDKNEGRRPAETWVEEPGAPYPMLVYGTHSQGQPHWKQTMYGYDPGSGTFRPVIWRFADGSVQTELVGFVHRQESGEIYYEDEQTYPVASCTFRYNAGEMQATRCQVRYAESEQQFVLMLGRPLNRESFVGMFADPAL
ncbi:MAG TPA: hypothetical protein VD902_19545, partial [Symbiobacteriaceae bacterium]|nr:hypothetical protein [Symbiobacteriaceae bacterium]